MTELSEQGVVSFRTEGEPPETYELLISAPGIAVNQHGTVAPRGIHRCTVLLHLDYPRRPPVIVWQTPILHPNILSPDRNGGVCLGGWSAGEDLADLTRRVIDLVTYRSFNLADALDPAAAALVREQGLAAGDDIAALVGREVVAA